MYVENSLKYIIIEFMNILHKYFVIFCNQHKKNKNVY